MEKSEDIELPKEVLFLEKFAHKKYLMKPNRIVVEISPADLREIIGLMRRELGDTGFYVDTIVGTDYPDEKVIQIDYYVALVPSEKIIVLRTRISRENPVIDSIIDIVPGVLSGECETHDLLGIIFSGNKYLKRGFFVPTEIADKGIYPLRKDSGV